MKKDHALRGVGPVYLDIVGGIPVINSDRKLSDGDIRFVADWLKRVLDEGVREAGVTTYAEYLESVKRQEARDRDRFMGHDSHEGEPMYSAETGHQTVVFSGEEVTVDILDAMMETFDQSLERIAQLFGVPGHLLTGIDEDELINGDGAVEPVGILEAE